MKTLQMLWVFLSTMVMLHAQPAYNEQILSDNGENKGIGIGGDGVAISAEWAFVGDADECLVYIYRLDYETMKWGNGAGTENSPFQVLGTNCNQNGFRDFGASISYADNWLFIGAPAKIKDNKKEGSMHLYHFNGATWTPASNSPITVGQKGGAFGASVSIRRVDDTTLLAIVGAPFDYNNTGTLASAPGKAYAYRIDTNVTDPIITNSISATGEAAGDQFGYAVTSDGTRFLVGAPYHDTGGTDSGRVYLYANASDTNPTIYDGSSPGELRGQELSLSSTNYMITTGQVSVVLDGNQTTPTTEYFSSPSNGGDASQSNGVVSLALRGTGVVLYPDISTSTEDNISVPSHGGNADFGRDINLYKDQLIVNGNDANADGEAYVYDFPCGIKPVHLNAAEWTMISIPCDVTGKTVADVFDNLGESGVDFIIAEQNGTNYSGSTAANVRLSNTDPVSQDKSYWLYLRNAQSWHVDETASSTRTTLDFTEGGLVSLSDYTGGYKLQTLPSSGAESGDNNVSVMLANPFPRPMDWSEVRVIANGLDTVFMENAGSFIKDSTAYVYDLNVTDSNGQNYRAVVPTPGFTDTIEPYQGFWIKILDQSDGTPNIGRLLLPFEK